MCSRFEARMRFPHQSTLIFDRFFYQCVACPATRGRNMEIKVVDSLDRNEDSVRE